MTLSTQRIFLGHLPGQLPGHLEECYQDEWKRLQAGEAIQKIWGKEPGLWKDDAAHARVIEDRLGWIAVLDRMQAEAAALRGFAREVVAAGLRQVVLLGMGGSSLGPEVFSLIFPAPAGDRRFFVLDTTDPAAILEVERSLDLSRTLFVVASKSGKTVETLSQFSYFHDRMKKAGMDAPGQNFIAITDSGSYLDHLAEEYQFRRTFRNHGDIGGRYSVLSYFGLVPAALWDVDLDAVLATALEMRTACAPQVPAAANPALHLGALLGAAAKHGDGKLALLTSPSLAPLGDWIEQLIAESTGKEGKGMVPIAGGGRVPIEVLARGCVGLALMLAGDDCRGLRATIEALKQRGRPVVEIELSDPAEVGGEFFKWEVATAVAGAALSIDPFDEPNVQESKDNTARILEEFQATGEMPLGSPRAVESGIALYTIGAAQEIPSILGLPEAMRILFAGLRPDDYVALLAFLGRGSANGEPLEALRAGLGKHLSVPVLLGYGPRYLHSIGQLYKGGPASGRFVVITAQDSEDLPIPGAKYTFGQLKMAQALGDLRSLVQRGKPGLRLHLGHGVPAGLAALGRLLDGALGASRRVSP